MASNLCAEQALAEQAISQSVMLLLRSPSSPRLWSRTSSGSVAAAEARLHARQTRVERLHIHPLQPDDAARFAAAWKNVQARFVDDPKGAVTEADRLVGEVMNARGYPVGEFDQQVDDISVDHPSVVMNYRAARDIAQDHERGRATTEDLRQAMVHYRALFTELLETAAAPSSDVESRPVAERRG